MKNYYNKMTAGNGNNNNNNKVNINSNNENEDDDNISNNSITQPLLSSSIEINGISNHSQDHKHQQQRVHYLQQQQQQKHNHANTAGVTYFRKISSALFYGLASFMITVVNKTVLTTYHFPSFLVLSIGQLLTSIIVLYFAKQLRIITFPNINVDTPKKIFPLPLIFLGNMMFGLGGTQALSLPMFAAMRRFSILFTMILEYYILSIYPSRYVQISVYAMIGGAFLAALNDLSYNLNGYSYVMITNTLTAANGVFVKKKLESIDMGKYGLMFYNSLFMIGPAVFGTWIIGDLQLAYDFPLWTEPFFVVQFILSCLMGFILSYSTILCTQYNSALTTTIVGCLKNICVTYLGMFIGGDYIFSWLNCIGINISVFGSLLYTYVTFRRKKEIPKNIVIQRIDTV